MRTALTLFLVGNTAFAAGGGLGVLVYQPWAWSFAVLWFALGSVFAMTAVRARRVRRGRA